MLFRSTKLKLQNSEVAFSFQDLENLLKEIDPSLLNKEDFPYSNLKKSYRNNHSIILSDWYDIYDELLIRFDSFNSIQKTELAIIGTSDNTKYLDDTIIDSNIVITNLGEFHLSIPKTKEYLNRNVICYIKGNTILTTAWESNKSYTVKNSFIMEVNNNSIISRINDYIIEFQIDEVKEEYREQVADIVLQSGNVSKILIKPDKVNGKILAVSEKGIELEGIGVIPVSEEVKVYCLFGELTSNKLSDLVVGYDFTDFVLENQTIVACLITRDEAMENIRVLLKSSDYQGMYHEKVELSVDSDFVIDRKSVV